MVDTCLEEYEVDPARLPGGERQTSLRDHPIHRCCDLGLLVTVNTDAPMMFNNSLTEE
jgi:hypothetical protein